MNALTTDNRNYNDMIDYYEARIEALERRLEQSEEPSSKAPAGASAPGKIGDRTADSSNQE